MNYLSVSQEKELISQVKVNDEISEDKKESILKSIRSSIGFRKIFEAVTLRGVPFIGHNCYMDLLFLQQSFNSDLPVEYSGD